MISTTTEIDWLYWLLFDIVVFLSQSTSMYCDNKSVIQVSNKSLIHERIKHVEIDCRFTCHHLQHRTNTLSFVEIFSKTNQKAHENPKEGETSLITSVGRHVNHSQHLDTSYKRNIYALISKSSVSSKASMNSVAALNYTSETLAL